MTKQELRAPDAFQQIGAEARNWFAERRKLVAIAAGVVVLGGAVLAIGSFIAERNEARANKALGEALQVLSRPIQGAPGEEALVPGQAPFATEKARDEALQKALSDFRVNYSGSKAAVTAALPLAEAEFRLGNYDAAAQGFEAFLAKAPADDLLKDQAQEGLGYVREAKGDFAQALVAFDTLSQSKQNEFLAATGAYQKGRMLVLLNKPQEAAQVFSALQTSHPGTAAARLAAERLTVLAGQGIVPAAAPVKSTPDAG